jgi:transcriptional regulator with XRE-family HTH domain
MDIYRSEFGRRLKEARLRAGLKQHQIAEATNVDQSAVSNWERGEDFPDDDRLPGICQLLGVTEEYFTRPEQIIRTDPLPQWAEGIQANLLPIEQAAVGAKREVAKLREELKNSTRLEPNELTLLALFRQVPTSEIANVFRVLESMLAGLNNSQLRPPKLRRD